MWAANKVVFEQLKYQKTRVQICSEFTAFRNYLGFKQWKNKYSKYLQGSLEKGRCNG